MAYRRYIARVLQFTATCTAPPPLVSARKIRQDSQNQAYAKYLARSLDFDIFPVSRRRFPRKFLPRIDVLSSSTSPASALVTRPEPLRSDIPNDQPSPAHQLKNPRLPKPTQRPSFIYEQYWADHKTLALASKLSRDPCPTQAEDQFFTVGLPFLLGYKLLRRRGPVTEGLSSLSNCSSRLLSSYNHWDQRLWIGTFQRALMSVRNFSPPPFTWFRGSPSSPSTLQEPVSQLLVLHLAAFQCAHASVPSEFLLRWPVSSQLVTSLYLAVFRVVLQGGGHGRRNEVHLFPPRAHPRKPSVFLSNPHAGDQDSTRSHARLSTSGEIKTNPALRRLLAASVLPPDAFSISARTRSELRIDPSIPQEGR